MTVEIVIPFWGRVDYLQKAVLSVLAQSDPDWVLTIIDDAYPSTEQSDWLAELGEPRINYMRNESNRGLNANFQRAIEIANHDRLTIMGCDDLLLPNYVEWVSKVAQNSDAELFQPGVLVVDDTGAPFTPLADRVKGWIRPRVSGPTEMRGEPIAQSLTRGNWLYFPSISWKTSALKSIGFRPEYGVVLDLALAMDVVLSEGAVLVDDEVAFAYRRHRSSESSATAFSGTRFDEERDVMDLFAGAFRSRGWHRAEREARIRLTSRLHALSAIPQALRAADSGSLLRLCRNALGN